MKRSCPECENITLDDAQVDCGHCGAPLDAKAGVSDMQADASRTAAPPTSAPQTSTPPTSTGQALVNAAGAVYGLWLLGLAVVVIGVGIAGLLGFGGDEKKSTPKEPALPVVNSFNSQAVYEKDRFSTRPARVLKIENAGQETFTDVEIEASVRFVSRSEHKVDLKVESWEPGKTHSLQLAEAGLALDYSWKGTAILDGKKVRIAGGRGAME